jgi:hypothetical protein
VVSFWAWLAEVACTWTATGWPETWTVSGETATAAALAGLARKRTSPSLPSSVRRLSVAGRGFAASETMTKPWPDPTPFRSSSSWPIVSSASGHPSSIQRAMKTI